MLKKIGHKKRFAITLIFIYIIFLPVISVITYFILKQSAINNAYDTARLYLTYFEATRHYVREELRPILLKEMPDRFVLEGMSGSYAARVISERVMQELPGYILRTASLKNPRNPKNLADEFEAGIINELITKRELKEWKGIIEKDGYHYYVLAHLGPPIEKRCLYCHGDPAIAPKELIQRYGKVAGFHMKEGDMANAVIAYIPFHIPLVIARDSAIIFAGIYTIFFAAIFWVINRRFGWFYEKIESDKRTIEDISKEILNLNREMEDIVAERTMGMVGLRVADRIRNPVTIIGGLCHQLIKKQIEGIPKDKLEIILDECRKMEKIVADFDELVKSKRFLFKHEDINEIATSTIKLIEQEIRDKNISLVFDMHEKPLIFNANRQLVKVAVRHVLSNAIDATASGGKITVSSGIKGDSVFLTIADTGKGMTPEELHRIFEPFYSTKGRTGMGLPLIRQIITEHMGEIAIDSKPNVGTTVQFLFPTRWKEGDIENHLKE